ncbi:MAG: ribosome hibernation-promoting factor, HPF/YfiA family [Tepidisphaeraceae bacterium]
MNIVVSSRHMDLTPALKAHAENKARKLLTYFDRIQEIEVVIDNTKDAIGVEVIVNAEHKKEFVAHHTDGDAYACINACVEKIERQVSEHKKELRNRKHAGGGATIRHD